MRVPLLKFGQRLLSEGAGYVTRTQETQAGLQVQGGARGAEWPGDAGPTGRQVRVHPGQIQAWKKALGEGASGVFGNGKEQKSRNDKVRHAAALIACLYQEIGQLKGERDFLAERSGP